MNLATMCSMAELVTVSLAADETSMNEGKKNGYTKSVATWEAVLNII